MKIFSCIILLFCGGCVATAQPSFLLQSEQLFENRQYAEVIAMPEKNPKMFAALNDNDRLTFTLDYYAMSYIAIGEFSKAEKLFLQTLDYCEKQYGLQSPCHDRTLSYLAWTYLAHGHYAEALKYYRQQYEYAEKIKQDNPENIAVLLDNIAKTFDLLGNVDSAAVYYAKAWDVYQEFLGADHPYYLMFINNLATFYDKIGYTDEASFLFTEVLHHLKEGWTYKLPYAAYLLNDLGKSAVKRQQTDFADYCFNTLYAKVGETSNRRLSGVFDDFTLAQYFGQQKDYDKAVPLMIKANRFYREHMKLNGIFIDNVQREAFWNTLSPKFNVLYSLAVDHPSKELSKMAYNNQLLLKSVLLETDVEIKQAILGANDPSLLQDYEELKKISKGIQQLFLGREADHSYITIMEERAQKLNQQLVDKVRPYALARRQQDADWLSIQNKLKDNEVAIEFICFDYEYLQPTGKIYYAALLIKKGWDAPQIVKLCEQKELDKVLKNYNVNNAESVKKFYTSSALYKLIWQPIAGYLQENSRIYYSLSGDLNRIAFNAVYKTPKDRLGRMYDLYQLSSTRKLLEPNFDKAFKPLSAAIFGEMDYSENKKAAGNFPLEISPLDDKNEIETIASLCKNYNIALYKGKAATKLNFELLNNQSPQLLHISAHGYYFPLDDVRYAALNLHPEIGQKYPMQRSVLAFSGVNQDRLTEGDDGMLTAWKIAEMNLSGLELVILSACETALGDINPNEGVMGMQRAFKLAGAQTMVMALWDVPVESTAVFMRNLYAAMMVDKTKTKHQLFKEAMDKLNDNQEALYNWAGFVMVD